MRYEEYLAEEFRDPDAPAGLTRREFLGAAGGIVIFFLWGGDLDAAEAPRQPGRRPSDGSEDWNAFLRVGADGRVTVFSGKVELGQGVHTSLAQSVAEELDVPLDRVTMVMADTDLCPYDMGTFGSRTTRFHMPLLRAAAAEARGILIQLAADQWGLPPAGLAVKDGKVMVTAQSGRAIPYADLARGQRIERHLTPRPEPEAPERYTVVGKPTLRRDGTAKVTGAAQYAGDIRLPGMLYARVLHAPAHGARRVSADLSEARKISGVQVVEQGDLIAVLAERPDLAAEALAAIKAEFGPAPSDLDDRTIYDHLVKTAGPGRAVAQGGDLEAGAAAAAQSFSQTYFNAYVAHAPMEPHTAVAKIEDGKVTVWASTQRPFGCKDEVAQAIGVPAGNVRVIVPFVGGGFGGKSFNLQAIQAARLAKATGRPVQVAWTREEEFFYDTYRPAAVLTIRSGIDREGHVTLWDYVVYNAGERGAPHFYAIPNHRTRSTSGQSPLATGAWRAPGNNSNAFAREQQMDLMASAAGLDPVEFRLRNLAPDAPARRVLEAAAKAFGYQPAKHPSGRGIGIAVGTDSGSWVAHFAEVVVDRKTGQVKVKRVVCAQDCGRVINPEGARMQMEGCITMGLGYALAEEIPFRKGEILARNFDNYALPRFSDLPRTETVLVGATEGASQGGGEPAIICMGAVIANAIFDAVGARLTHLPMTPARVLAAL